MKKLLVLTAAALCTALPLNAQAPGAGDRIAEAVQVLPPDLRAARRS